MRRHPQRSAEIGAKRERHIACGKRGGRPARRAARRAASVEGIVGRPIDVVVALPVSEAERNVRFAQTTPPAAFTRATGRASSVGTKSLCCGKPHVVGRPATLNDSLTSSGMPRRGRRSPIANTSSAARAASSARSKSRTQTAFSFGSRLSIRAMATSASSQAEMSLAASATVSSRTDLYFQSTFAMCTIALDARQCGPADTS